MPEVVFITPNFNGNVREEPIGTLLLATILRQNNISADILQFRHFGDIKDFNGFLDCALQKVTEKSPRIVSFYTRCDTYHLSLKIAERIKESLKNVYIVFGGPQADLSAEETIREISYVDFVCCGEGENTIAPLFSSLLAGTPNLTIPGLVYRGNDGSIIKNPRPNMIENLDTLPEIDYSLLDFNNESKALAKSLFPIDVGRGCPFACTYCSTKTFWNRKYRLKSSERIIEEIKRIHDRFGVTEFNFEHDMFTMNREKVVTTCNMLKDIGFQITWRCSARIDCLDKELVDIMYDAGLRIIFVGIETGSPRMQKLIKKNLKLDNVCEMIDYISEKGIAVFASFIFGFPEETEEDFSQTIALMVDIADIKGTTVHEHLCTFLPGTELTDKYKDKLISADVYSSITNDFAISECADLITAHPCLFPHLCEFKTEFRDKISSFPRFFGCWRRFTPIFSYISKKYSRDRLCDMYYDFVRCNNELWDKKASFKELAQNFINMFANDEKYEVLKEIFRFMLWSENAGDKAVEIFGFDAKAFTEGKDISQIEEKVTFVSCKADKSGKRELTFKQI